MKNSQGDSLSPRCNLLLIHYKCRKTAEKLHNAHARQAASKQEAAKDENFLYGPNYWTVSAPWAQELPLLCVCVCVGIPSPLLPSPPDLLLLHHTVGKGTSPLRPDAHTEHHHHREPAVFGAWSCRDSEVLCRG